MCFVSQGQRTILLPVTFHLQGSRLGQGQAAFPTPFASWRHLQLERQGVPQRLSGHLKGYTMLVLTVKCQNS